MDMDCVTFHIGQGEGWKEVTNELLGQPENRPELAVMSGPKKTLASACRREKRAYKSFLSCFARQPRLGRGSKQCSQLGVEDTIHRGNPTFLQIQPVIPEL